MNAPEPVALCPPERIQKILSDVPCTLHPARKSVAAVRFSELDGQVHTIFCCADCLKKYQPGGLFERLAVGGIAF